MTAPIRVPSSTRLPPEPDRLAATKRTRMDFVFLIFACLGLAIVIFFVIQCTAIYLQKRALEAQANRPAPPSAAIPADGNVP